MRIILVLSAVLAAASAPGCARSDPDPAKVQVVTALHPLAEIARAVGGERVEATDLTPPGVEPHDLELKPSDVERVQDADVLLLIGQGFQPAMERAADGADGATVLDVLADGEDDPHIWLDPRRMIEITNRIRDSLTARDRDGRALFEQNAGRFASTLRALDTEFRDGLASCARRNVVTAHDAFGHLARRYELDHVGIAGIDPAAEPSPGRVDEITKLVKQNGVTTIFTEELVSPKVAEALAREAGVRTAVLDPVESALENERASAYAPRMRKNLAALRRALDCA